MSLETQIIDLFSKIIKESNDVVLFSRVCHTVASILDGTKDEIEKNKLLKDISQKNLSEIVNKSKQFLEVIKELENIDFISFASSDKSIQQLITNIIDCTNCIFKLLNKDSFAISIKISQIMYYDLVELDERFESPKDKNNELIQKKREEIKELFKQIPKPDDNSISISNDFENFIELNSNPKFKLDQSDYDRDENFYYDNVFLEYYNGNKKSDPKEKYRVMKLRDKSKFKRLFTILTSVDHQYIESFVGASISNSEIEIVTRKTGVSLKDLLLNKNDDDICIEPGELTIIAFKIAQAMAYLHSHGIIHRDLNISDIYIQKYQDGEQNIVINPIITNFANSHLLTGNSILSMTNNNEKSSKSHFIAPELTDTPFYDEKVDVFAFAGILYELLTNHCPFEEEIKRGSDAWALVKDGKRPELPKDCSKELSNLIQSCWNQKSSERPSFHSIINAMLPKKDSNMIIFPYDDNQVDSIQKFYEKFLITSTGVKECLDTFEQIKENIGSAYQYRFELFRARPLISNYQYYLQNSKYKSETNFSNEENEIIAILNSSLKNLLEIILKNTQGCWKKTAQLTKVDKTTKQLNDNMDIIFDSMKKLGFDDVEKYKECDNDLVFDYRQLYNDFDNYIKIIEEEKLNCDLKNKKEYKKLRNIYNDRKSEIDDFYKEKKLNGLTKQVIIGQIKDIFAQFKSYEKNKNDFDISKECIACGASSKVHNGYNIHNDTEYAIKIFKEDYIMRGEESLNHLNREVANLVRMNNEYIVDFIGFYIPDNSVCVWLILEYIDGGKLSESISYLNGSMKTKIAFEIAEGMEYIHSKRIIHRDLNPFNILLKESNESNAFDVTPKICDFGLSCSSINDVQKTLNVGTFRYKAPEVIEGGYYGMQADVYSYAMILCELVNNKKPFDGLSNEDIEKNIKEGLRPKLENCPPALEKLIFNCSDKKFIKRPSFTDIIDRMIRENIMFSGADKNEVKKFYDEKIKKRNG